MYACGGCGTTDSGPRRGRDALCTQCDDEAYARRAANYLIRRATDRWLTEAKERHPSGKGPRYRASQLWMTCLCATPTPCPYHGGEL